jgi:hypothetical protein
MAGGTATKRDLLQKVSIMEGTLHALIERLHQHEQAITILLNDKRAKESGSPLDLIPPKGKDNV